MVPDLSTKVIDGIGDTVKKPKIIPESQKCKPDE
jgi:hypothetical protein